MSYTRDKNFPFKINNMNKKYLNVK